MIPTYYQKFAANWIRDNVDSLERNPLEVFYNDFISNLDPAAIISDYVAALTEVLISILGMPWVLNRFDKEISSFSFYELTFPSDTLTIPNGIDRLKSFSFSRLSGPSHITMPTVKELWLDSLSNIDSLKSVAMPQVIEVGIDAFKGCSNLTDVEFGNNLQRISNGAFSHCGNLTTIRLPRSVDIIGYGAFNHCPLQDIYFEGTLGEWKRLRSKVPGALYGISVRKKFVHCIDGDYSY